MNRRIKKKKLKEKIKYPITILDDAEYSDELFLKIQKKYPDAYKIHLTDYGYGICLDNSYFRLFINSLQLSYRVLYFLNLRNYSSEDLSWTRKNMQMLNDMTMLNMLENLMDMRGDIYAGRD